MHKLTLSLQTMYGDHHVTEVRRLLLELPGVEEVYASSCFQVVEVTFDEKKVTDEKIKAILEASGYQSELKPPTEAGVPTYGIDGTGKYLRHTATFQQIKRSIGFVQAVSDGGRPLWPCPGMGVIEKIEDGET